MLNLIVFKINEKKLGIAGLILSFSMIFLLWQYGIDMTQAQETETNFQSLLEELNQRVSNERGFLLTFILHPNIIGEGNVITVGLGNTTDEISIRIGEIGKDYICLSERGGSSLLIRCLPFSSIQSVTYLAN